MNKLHKLFKPNSVAVIGGISKSIASRTCCDAQPSTKWIWWRDYASNAAI